MKITSCLSHFTLKIFTLYFFKCKMRQIWCYFHLFFEGKTTWFCTSIYSSLLPNPKPKRKSLGPSPSHANAVTLHLSPSLSSPAVSSLVSLSLPSSPHRLSPIWWISTVRSTGSPAPSSTTALPLFPTISNPNPLVISTISPSLSLSLCFCKILWNLCSLVNGKGLRWRS